MSQIFHRHQTDHDAICCDYDARSEELITRAFDGETEGLSRDDIVDNITLYWLTNTAVCAARSYWDYSSTAKKGFFDVKGVTAVRW